MLKTVDLVNHCEPKSAPSSASFAKDGGMLQLPCLVHWLTGAVAVKLARTTAAAIWCSLCSACDFSFVSCKENTELYYRALKAIRSAPPPMPVDIREALGLEIKEEKQPGCRWLQMAADGCGILSLGSCMK